MSGAVRRKKPVSATRANKRIEPENTESASAAKKKRKIGAAAGKAAPEQHPSNVVWLPSSGGERSEIDEASAGATMTARVDGRRVVVEAEDEIELRCGKASLILRRNGRILIRGAHIETRAEGKNRVRGGSVEIN